MLHYYYLFVCFVVFIYLFILFLFFIFLQRYLNRFRVTELKELLKSMGVTQKGKKPELFSRALSLLEHGSPKLMSEIIRIYERTHALPRKSIKTGDYSSGSSRSHYPDSKPGSSSFVVKDSRSYIVHPDVKFKPHPFYENIECIIRPTALGKEGGRERRGWGWYWY